MPHPPSRGVKNWKKNKPQNTTKPVSKHLKNYLYVALLLLQLEDDL
jgi:hypothetical protein